MSAKIILSEDWKDYDDRKKKKEDREFFSCEEPWEVEYLVEKISRNFPKLEKEKIHAAIKQCCNAVAPPRPRKKFVECVMSRLGFDDHSGGGTPPPNQGPGPKNPPIPPANRNVG
jgi:hypothetical protein